MHGFMHHSIRHAILISGNTPCRIRTVFSRIRQISSRFWQIPSLLFDRPLLVSDRPCPPAQQQRYHLRVVGKRGCLVLFMEKVGRIREAVSDTRNNELVSLPPNDWINYRIMKTMTSLDLLLAFSPCCSLSRLCLEGVTRLGEKRNLTNK